MFLGAVLGDRHCGTGLVLRNAHCGSDASITTGDIYMQQVDASVQQAVNSRTKAVLEEFIAPVTNMGLHGRNIKRPEAVRRIARADACKLLIYWLLR